MAERGREGEDEGELLLRKATDDFLLLSLFLTSGKKNQLGMSGDPARLPRPLTCDCRYLLGQDVFLEVRGAWLEKIQDMFTRGDVLR